ncbi:hypothetical protein BLA29_011326 [Euroglyphus maynei]|uniref:Uncharacterized protein n=1 Tax=Euroglyphus maynei TaxID=6958 RepID=A0A1Y3AL68_EURMA|nr:hypothetical protein BLA29_011326 [Euroglyphus maynei]
MVAIGCLTVVSADIDIEKTEVVLMDILEELIQQARQSSTDSSSMISISNKIKTLVLTTGLSNRADIELMIDLIRLALDVGKTPSNKCF